jgi:hypothetical protein
VRLALWVTHAWTDGAGRGSLLEQTLARALPDAEYVAGDVQRLDLWHELGESALLVALPAPGDLRGMPSAGPDAVGAAAAAGECVYVPGLGGMLVPTVTTFGAESAGAESAGAPSGPAARRRSLDVGTRVDWTAYDSDPVPRHRVEALDAGQLERSLRELVAEATAGLERVGGRPFAHRMGRELADAAAGGRWALPPGLPPRADRVIRLAGTVSAVAGVALETPDDSLSVTTSTQRRQVLQRLRRGSERALADAASAACAAIAGWVPAR